MNAELHFDLNTLEHYALHVLLITAARGHAIKVVIRQNGQSHIFNADWLKRAQLRVKGVSLKEEVAPAAAEEAV